MDCVCLLSGLFWEGKEKQHNKKKERKVSLGRRVSRLQRQSLFANLVSELFRDKDKRFAIHQGGVHLLSSMSLLFRAGHHHRDSQGP